MMKRFLSVFLAVGLIISMAIPGFAEDWRGPDHEHSYCSWVAAEPGCIEGGEEVFECDCGDRYTQALAPLGHAYEGGRCIRCGEPDPSAAAPESADGGRNAIPAQPDASAGETERSLADKTVIHFWDDPVSTDPEDAWWISYQPIISRIDYSKKKKQATVYWDVYDTDTYQKIEFKLPKNVKYYVYMTELSTGRHVQVKTTTKLKVSVPVKKPGMYAFCVRPEYVKNGVERYGIASHGWLSKIDPDENAWQKLTDVQASYYSYKDSVGKRHYWMRVNYRTDSRISALQVRYCMTRGKEKIYDGPKDIVVSEIDYERLSKGLPVELPPYEVEEGEGWKVTCELTPMRWDSQNSTYQFGKTKRTGALALKPPADWKKAAPVIVDAIDSLNGIVAVYWTHECDLPDDGNVEYQVLDGSKVLAQGMLSDFYGMANPRYGNKVTYSAMLVGIGPGKHKFAVKAVGGKKSKVKSVTLQKAGKTVIGFITSGPDAVYWYSDSEEVDHFEVGLSDVNRYLYGPVVCPRVPGRTGYWLDISKFNVDETDNLGSSRSFDVRAVDANGKTLARKTTTCDLRDYGL